MEPLTIVGGTQTASAARSEVFWIETLSRHHEVITRQRCFVTEIHIGRGYDNDVIVDDPHVAANHLIVRRGADGRLRVDDRGSLSGFFVGSATQAVRSAPIDGHTLLRVGSTLLRIRTPEHIVEPEQPLHNHRDLWPQASILVVCVGLVTLLDLWCDDIDEPQVSRYATRLLLLLAIGMIWTTLWAVLSRIFGGIMQYGRHLAVAFGGLLVLSFYDSATQFGAYGLAAGTILRYTYIGSWLIFGAVCLLHLLTISPRHPVLKSAGVAALLALAIGAQSLSQGDLRRVMGSSSVARHLEPPGLRITAAASMDHFFEASGRLRSPLERARTQEAPPVSADGFDSDGDD